MQALVGQNLNRYNLTSIISEGGIGAVFRAQDTGRSREVAVKVVHSQFTQQPDFREKFFKEVLKASRLDHPGIVRILDFGEAQQTLYVVMEFLQGENLQDRLAQLLSKEGAFPPREAAKLIRDVARALHYIHQQESLSRDIKPASILLKAEPSADLPYQPIFTDLGLAQLVEPARLAQAGVSRITPAYMSPEQAAGQPVDARSDVYSLGVLLYELVVGRLPFPIHSVNEAVRYHIKETPPSPQSLRENIPASLEAAIQRALEKDPVNRFDDAETLALKLDKMLPGLSRKSGALVGVAAAAAVLEPSAKPLHESPGKRTRSFAPKVVIPPGTDGVLVSTRKQPDRFIPIKPRVKDVVEMSIGRDEEADISIDSPGVSRNHAKLTFDGTGYYLTDLMSTNHTYLDDTELLPGVAERWNPEKVANIGNFRLRLILGGKPAQAPEVPKEISHKQSSREAVEYAGVYLTGDQKGDSQVWIELEENELTVEAGEKVILTINLVNQGEYVDQFHVSVPELPETWVTVQQPVVNLMPGDKTTLLITFHPPRQPSSRAGTYEVMVYITPEKPPKKLTAAQVKLTILPFALSKIDLHPQKIEGKKTVRITVQNMGNCPENFVMQPEDKGDELYFKPPVAQIQVPEGQQMAVGFRARTRAVRWLGGKQSHPYSINVTPGRGTKQSYSGEYVSKALIPFWLPIALLAMCALLAFSVKMAIPLFQKDPTPTPTLVPLEVTLVADSLGPAATAINITPSPEITLTPTPTPACPGAPIQKLKRGDQGIVIDDGRGRLYAHTVAEYTDGSRMANPLPINTPFEVISKPVCYISPNTGVGVWMLQIRVAKDVQAFIDSGKETRVGWIVEGEGRDYFVDKK